MNGWRLHGDRTGIARVLANLVSRWTPEAIAGHFDDVTVYSPGPTDRAVVKLAPGISERILGPRLPMVPWENLRFGPTADGDVLFCPSFSRPLVARGRTVVAIHDATGQLHPEGYPRSQPLYNRLYAWSARHATLVLTSTEAVRRDIARLWGAPLERIRVVPLAAAENFSPVRRDSAAGQAAERFLGGPIPYLLYVGKVTGRSRLTLLMRAFAEFKQTTWAPHRLLLVGPRPPEGLPELLQSLRIAADVRHCGFVTDEELNQLYNGAEAVVCPSVYEAVSLPIMEAQATGTPVICVDSPGTRETSGGAALFMNGLTPATMVDALVRITGSAGLRSELGAAGFEHSQQFSWERTAIETLDVLKEAGNRV